MKLNGMFENIFWQIGYRPKMIIDNKPISMDIIAESILGTPAIVNQNVMNLVIIIKLASKIKHKRKHTSNEENNNNCEENKNNREENKSHTTNNTTTNTDCRLSDRSSVEYVCDLEDDLEIRSKSDITCWDVINKTNDWFRNNQNGMYYVASTLNVVDDCGIIELIAYELQ